MNELIKVNYNNDQVTISERDLYNFSEVGTQLKIDLLECVSMAL